MEDKDLENIRLLMWDNLDLALQLIEAHNWELKKVLLKLYNKYRKGITLTMCDMKYCDHNFMNIYTYDSYISVWYEDENIKIQTIPDAIDWIIQQLISDNKWNT